MKNKVSVRMSDENMEFWKKGNLNLTLLDKTKQFDLTPSDFQSYIVKYFKLNNDRYVEMAQLILQMESKKNGIK